QAPVCRVRRVVEVEGFAGPAARGDALDLESKDVGDRRRTSEPGQIEFDRLELNAPEIADQVLTDERGRAARLAADDRGERLALSVIRAFVDHAGEDPIAVRHDLARADHQRELQPVETGVAAASLVD